MSHLMERGGTCGLADGHGGQHYSPEAAARLREYRREYSREYRERNRERVLEQKREYQREYHKRKAADPEWVEAERVRHREKAARYRTTAASILAQVRGDAKRRGNR